MCLETETGWMDSSNLVMLTESHALQPAPREEESWSLESDLTYSKLNK